MGIFLEKFVLPIEKEETIIAKIMGENGGGHGYIDNKYPCGIFDKKRLEQVDFGCCTIFYGGNGSGKSTLLNLIATKLELNRVAPFNSSETFSSYVNACKYSLGYDDEGFPYRVPNGSRIITSDDVFDYMLAVRTNNEDIRSAMETAKNEWAEKKYGETVRISGMDDYDSLRSQVLARSKSTSRRQYIRKIAGEEVTLASNGETALQYFDKRLRNDTLYCLDEPENSLSPKLQKELTELLAKLIRYCGCQFIIATHSPFLLSLDGAKIYDLDSCPVVTKNWYELENVRLFYDFFKQKERLFN